MTTGKNKHLKSQNQFLQSVTTLALMELSFLLLTLAQSLLWHLLQARRQRIKILFSRFNTWMDPNALWPPRSLHVSGLWAPWQQSPFVWVNTQTLLCWVPFFWLSASTSPDFGAWELLAAPASSLAGYLHQGFHLTFLLLNAPRLSYCVGLCVPTAWVFCTSVTGEKIGEAPTYCWAEISYW